MSITSSWGRIADVRGVALAAPFILAVLIWIPGLAAGGLPKWLVLYAAAFGAVFCVSRLDKISLVAIALTAWAGLSGVWGADQAWLPALQKWVAVLAVFLIAREHGHKLPLGWLVAGVSLVAIVMGLFEPKMPFNNENFGAEWMVMTIPLLALFPWHIGVPIGAAVIGYLVFLNPAKIEFLILPLLAAIYIFRRGEYPAAAIVGLAPLSGLAIIPSAALMESIGPRIELYTGAVKMWLAYPLGIGLGSFDHLFPAFQPAESWFKVNQFAGAVHCEYLQLLVEIGPIGVGLAGCFSYLCLKGAKETPILYCVIAGALLAGLGFPFQNAPTALLMAVCLGIIAGKPESLVSVRLPAKAAFGAVAAGVIALGAMEAKAHFLYGQSAIVLHARPVDAFKLNLAAYRAYPWDWQIRNQLFASFVNMAAKTETNISGHNLKRLFDISHSASPYSPRLKAAVASINLEHAK